MPLLFFIDKDILDDPACRDVDDVVLSYTFFRYVPFYDLLNTYSCTSQVLEGMLTANWNLMPRRTWFRIPLVSVATSLPQNLSFITSNQLVALLRR